MEPPDFTPEEWQRIADEAQEMAEEAGSAETVAAVSKLVAWVETLPEEERRRAYLPERNTERPLRT